MSHSDRDISIVADLLNDNLTPSGWDIGVINDIASYCVDRGMIILEADEVDWHRRYESASDEPVSDNKAGTIQPLDMEVKHMHTNDPQDDTPWTSFRNPDYLKDEMLSEHDGRVNFLIDMTIEYRYLEETAERVAALVAQFPGTDYSVSVQRRINPVRIDNNPF